MAADQSPDLSAMMRSVLEDPARMAQLQGIISALGGNDAAGTDAAVSEPTAEPPAEGNDTTAAAPTVSPDLLSSLLSSPELLSRMPALLSGAGKPSGKPGAPDHRTALLLALKPYLSDNRRQMIDSIVNLSRLGNLLNR
ncbi:MAG: hypothetical protein IKD37_02280 [Clostridia bacterium]|nr:hypothetical protein [Clostridia bacterium]